MSSREKRTLDLSPDEMRALGYRIVDGLVGRESTIAAGPVLESATREEMNSRVWEPLPQQPTDFEQVLRRLEKDVLPFTVRETHPRFFAFVPGPSNFVGAMGDAIASGVNVFAASWLESAGPSTVELVTLDWIRTLCGLPETAAGIFVSGGSIANLTALVAARHARVDPDAYGRATLYCSDQTHSSIHRALRVMGIPPSHLRKLPTDASFRVRACDVEAGVKRDRAQGLSPFCVIANAGTTNTGAIDPLHEIADVCAREGLWLHADGAFGVAGVFAERTRGLFAGLERVDSLSVDPHKWLFQPFACGVVLARDGAALRAAFSTSAEYLKDAEGPAAGANLWDYGPELTRPWRALKLWMSLQVFGARAFDAAIDHCVSLAETAQRAFESKPHWRITSRAQLAVVTARYEPAGTTDAEGDDLNRRIGKEITRSAFALVLSTELRGRTVLRLCTINPRTTDDDIRATIDRLDGIGRDLAASTAKASATRGRA